MTKRSEIYELASSLNIKIIRAKVPSDAYRSGWHVLKPRIGEMIDHINTAADRGHRYIVIHTEDTWPDTSNVIDLFSGERVA